ncbi:MAG: hypothetical protein H8E34_08300 [Bacteroidetes bacterium]|nr:hypothetical protein [Bacteroidota bacterium]MBL6944476.1 hypothetical protein [Bacteroidales bacterium]
MSIIRKLKPDRSIIGFVPLIVSLVIFFMSILIIGVVDSFKVLSLIMLVYAAITLGFYYRKTRSRTYLISGLYLIVFGLTLWTIQIEFAGNPSLVFPPITRFFGIWMIVFWVWLLYLMATRKVKWKGEEVLELSAVGVNPSENTFTERPLPIEKIDFLKDELISFASFMRKNQICMTYQDDDKIYIVPITMKDSMNLLINPEFNVIEKTWVSFTFTGDVTVHISKNTYLAYKENLTFDQLCKSMGSLFIEFFESYRKGESVRVIDRLDELKLNIFT